MRCAFTLLVLFAAQPAFAADPVFKPADIFDLEHASDPQISPDGTRVAFVRNSFDMMKDRARSRLWVVNADGSDLRPLCDGTGNESSPRWSPDGKRVAYITDASGKLQLHCIWLNTRETAKLTSLTTAPTVPVWSPDGKQIAFAAFVERVEKPYIEMPAKPAGAEWAPAAKVIHDTTYRHDGLGYLKAGNRHVFVVSADGGAARQVTTGPHDYCGARFTKPESPVWCPEGKSLIVSTFRRKDAGDEPYDSDLFEVALADGSLKQITVHAGPDHSPTISPDGKQIAFLGFDDKHVAHQQTKLYAVNRDGSNKRLLSEKLDREVSHPRWDASNRGVFVQYPEHGDIKVAFVDVEGRVTVVAEKVGGLDLGRPYSSGGYSVSNGGAVAYTLGSADRPADVGIRTRTDTTAKRLTTLNENLLGHRTLGGTEEVWFPAADGKKIQAWMVKPPHFDAKKKYPLILEIHGGPYADYGPTFASEIQLYAAAGYVVLFVNPRGSTGYGEAFAQLINGTYPGPDYDDLMTAVDVVVKKGFIDEESLFVTGGSGGGILTAWIVGKTDRFRAAVSCKPVINWQSFVLTADIPGYFAKYWLTAMPWDKPDEAMKRSPLSLVGRVKTPTMLLTGEDDHRTPISESEQFYTALKLRGIDTALVRFPEASHAIVDRPSRMIAKTLYILKWFETHAKLKGMSHVSVSPDKKGFVLEASGKKFVPWGFNYDHDEKGRLLEDYWEAEWPKVERAFRDMKKLGANVVRVHLQLGRFMEDAEKPNAKALDQLKKLLALAEAEGLYLDITGLGCYHKADVPAWYDKLSEQDRWSTQARFWEAVAKVSAPSPAVFCYDLMNEPVVPAGKRKDADWLGPAFGGKHFVQVVSLDQKDRPRAEIAAQWIRHLSTAIRKVDKRHLITVGLVDWSLDRKGMTSGFVPEKIIDDLDFVCVHLYPEKGKLDEAMKTLEGFSLGKPVVIEETFPLKCSMAEFAEFVKSSRKHACGWVGFYWGTPPEELRKSKTIGDAIQLSWLEFFERYVKTEE